MEKQLPWEPRNEAERPYERVLRSRILKIAQDRDNFLKNKEESVIPAQEAINNAEAILQIDNTLRMLRFNLVPKHLSEEEFWQKYFINVENIRKEVLAEQTTLMAVQDEIIMHISSADLRHLGSALEMAKGFRKMQDLSDTGKPVSGGTKSTLRRAVEAGKKMLARVSSKNLQVIVNAVWELFDPDAIEKDLSKEFPSAIKLSSQIGAVGLLSFLAHLVKHLCSLNTMSEMSILWMQCVDEIAWHWKNLKPIPRIPVESAPDLTTCMLHQKLMLLNCCIARKVRFEGRKKQIRDVDPMYVNVDGTQMERRGHKKAIEGLLMLRTSEEIYAPETQEAPVFTEELMRETDEMIMKTGSVGPGLQQLLSDMQAFKAANPGCVIEDFVRWYSPSDWISEGEEEAHLSTRMMEPGNMWTELFKQAKPLPASEQNPLFDMEYNGDMIVEGLSNIAPSDLFEQLFLVTVMMRHASCERLAVSVEAQTQNSEVMSGISESQAFSISTCCRGMSWSKIERICEAYEKVEAFIKSFDKEDECTSPKQGGEDINDWFIV